MEMNKLAVWPDRKHVCRLIPNARASWVRGGTISDFYGSLLIKLPVKAQELLNNAPSFNLYIRDYSRLDFHWLPQISVETNLVELQDGIYDFRIGQLSSSSDWGLTSCASNWLNHSFNNLPWPFTSLAIVDRVVSSLDRSTSRSENFILKFAYLFHCKKQNDRVIYLHGMPGVGKSALLEQILKLVVGPNMVTLNNTKGPFQFDNITEADILVLNEYLSGRSNTQAILSLSEGAPFIADRKYVPSKVVNAREGSKKHLV
jgi:hypothetical protein